MIIFYSLQKYFPFCSSFFLPLLLLWASVISDIQRYSSTSVCLSVCLSDTHSVTRIHFFPHTFPWSQTSSCRIPAFVYNLQPTESFGLPQVVEVYLKDTAEKERKTPQGSGGSAAHGQASQTGALPLQGSPRQPRCPRCPAVPAHVARAALDSRYDSAALGRLLLHFDS